MERPYQRLIVWQEAHKLCLQMYAVTKKFPEDERYGLTNQIRRASSSVPINIAEGNSKRSAKEKRRFMDIALGSLNEVHCEILLSKDLTYICEEEFRRIDMQIQRVSYLLIKLRLYLQK